MKITVCFLAAFFLSTSVNSQDARITFSSDDQNLVKGFDWAKKQAMFYVFRNNDPVGPWYEAALPKREAFCMRDVSHQLVGAQLLGLADINRNLLSKFVAAIAESRDWCGYWEINRYNLPAPVDYKSDTDFWYNLPANFDMIDACYRAWLWTHDSTYLIDPVFVNFYEKSLNEYVRKWDPDGDGLMEGNADSTNSRGLSSYNEEKYGRVGADLLAAQYISNLDYSKMLRLRKQPEQAKDYLNRANKIKNHINANWWDTHNKLYHHYIKYDGKWLDDNQMMSFLLRWNVVPENRAPAVINHLLAVVPKTCVEMNTYYPLETYRFGNPQDAYRLLIRLVSPDLKRREYPEVSFAAIEAYAMGLMGIEADAETRSIVTKPRLTSDTGWAELKDIPVFDGTVTIRHDGLTHSTFTNNTQEIITWVIHEINGTTRKIAVKPGETKTHQE
ncbi:MAG: hypothetical protein PHY99_04115 [Bacteroidales bacterium]|nr:hypothetical protein [Bacteroidales bacterium]